MRHQAYRTVSNAAGFTFIEMLTALSIGVVLSFVAVPNLLEFRRGYRLTATANQVAYDIARARMKAVGEHRIHRVWIGTGDQSDRYRLERSDDGLVFTADGPTIILPGGLRFSNQQEQTITFSRQGVGTAALELIVQDDAVRVRRVQVTTLGRVTVS
jgi:prepilin-type N-terminal cleavage/methylation domain-containing protein